MIQSRCRNHRAVTEEEVREHGLTPDEYTTACRILGRAQFDRAGYFQRDVVGALLLQIFARFFHPFHRLVRHPGTG